ncbi:MAG: hypothetical protein SGBAC_011536 [Bacillariaceae sp.]
MGNDSIGPTESFPNTDAYQGGAVVGTDITIKNIYQDSSDNMVFDICFGDCAPGEDVPSIEYCEDDALWKDSDGIECEEYETEWCSDAEDWADAAGVSALTACCMCKDDVFSGALPGTPDVEIFLVLQQQSQVLHLVLTIPFGQTMKAMHAVYIRNGGVARVPILLKIMALQPTLHAVFARIRVWTILHGKALRDMDAMGALPTGVEKQLLDMRMNKASMPTWHVVFVRSSGITWLSRIFGRPRCSLFACSL